MNRRILEIVFVLVLVLDPDRAAMSAPPLAVSTEVSFRRDCVCSTGIVRLADVAEVRGPVAESEALKNISLFPAPELGVVRELKSREVQELLTLHGVDPRSVRFTGASTTVVRAGEKSAAPVARATAATINPAIMQVSASKPVVATPADAAEERLVVAAVKPLKRGEIIQPGDVVLKSIPAAKSKATNLAHVDDVVGRELVRALNTGELLESSMIRLPILVRRGEMVSVHVRGSGINLRTTAQSLDEGGRGSLVTVQSLLDKKEKFTARVIDFQSVEVMAQASIVPSPSFSR